MKYAMMALAACFLFACNEGPDNDRMEDRSRTMDAQNQERTYDSPEMSGEYDEMRQPVDQVNPPEDMVPFTHEIRNDSVIAPIEGGDGSYHTGSKTLDTEVNTNGTRNERMQGSAPATGSQPVMPEGGTMHHSSGNVNNVDGANTGTTIVPITEEGVNQPPGAQHMSQDGQPMNPQNEQTSTGEMNDGEGQTTEGDGVNDSLEHHQGQMPQEP